MSLRLRGATYRYAGSSATVLRGIDLDVERGEVLGVVGANDAGKSTLCLVAAGLAPAAIGGRLEGSVQLNGVETSALPPHDAAESCGILFQNPLTQLSGTTATTWEEVAFGPRNLGLSLGEIVERVEWALASLRIEDLAPRDPARLSGGQAQLVALASILALRPAVLVLDEPTSQLDPAGTRLVGDALARLAADAATAILIVEHKTDLLARLAHRISVIADGSVVMTGTPATVLADARLPELGVEPPSDVLLERAASEAGLDGLMARVDLRQVPRSVDSGRDQPRSATTGTLAPSGQPEPASPPRIAIDDLGFVYPDGTRALERVSLRVRTGERLALVGQNGSGKSTLVRQLNGLLRPTTGSVAIDGVTVGRRHVAELARSVGLAFQNPDRQIFARRARDEVAFGPRNLGVEGDELHARVAEALAWVGLDDHADTNPYDLGFSNRKLLTIASILAMQTPIVILDEPTTGQDARGVERVSAIVDRLHAEGRTVVAISHDMRFVAEVFDRVVVMRRGSVVLDAPTELAFDQRSWRLLESTYLEPPLAARVGAALAIGSTPTVKSLIAAVQQRSTPEALA